MKHKKHLIYGLYTFLIVIAGLQVFYWSFANSVEPIRLGLPYGMFVVTLLIVIEFLVLLVLYFVDRRR